jgi:hypothetical protein
MSDKPSADTGRAPHGAKTDAGASDLQSPAAPPAPAEPRRDYSNHLAQNPSGVPADSAAVVLEDGVAAALAHRAIAEGRLTLARLARLPRKATPAQVLEAVHEHQPGRGAHHA